MFLSQFSTEDAILILLGSLRICSVVFALPKVGNGAYLFFVRLMFGVAVSLTMAPLAITQSSGLSGNDWISLAVSEISVGLVLGAAGCCVVWGMHGAGQLVSHFLGFQMGSLQQGLSPEQGNDYRKLLYLLGVMFWFAIGGHRLIITGLMQSFVHLPLGEVHLSRKLLDLLNLLIRACLEFSIRFALPVVAVGIVGYLLAGLSGKILGAGQTMIVGMNLNQVAALLLLPTMLIVFYHEVQSGTLKQIEIAVGYLSELKVR